MSDQALATAVESVLQSLAAPGAEASIAALDTVRRSADPLLRGSSGPERLRDVAAVIVAHARRGEYAEAMRLAETETTDERLGSRGPARDLSLILSAAAEAFATPGLVRFSTPLGQRALSHAELAGDIPLQFRARALLTVSQALNGQYNEAAEQSRVCRSIQQAQGWPVSSAFFPLLLGEILIASARFDAAGLRSIAGQLRPDEGASPLWSTTAVAAEAMAFLIGNDAGQAIARLRTVLGDADEKAALPIVRGFCLGMYADVLLARGEPRRALRAIGDRQSPRGHALCFDMQRSSAQLMLGDDRAALLATEECIRLGSEHCLRTLPPVLLRRAIAFHRLGHGTSADETFEEAFHLIQTLGTSTPLLTLPSEVLLELLTRLDRRRPEFAGETDAFRARLAAVPAADRDRSALPPLSPREGVLAAALRTGESLPSIARGLQVSLNTVKSQAQTLYRKLGVSSRGDAVSLLERAGFFD